MLWFRAYKWPQQLVIVIPGNPGLPGYYHEFAQALHQQAPETREVVVLGHAGHYDNSPTLSLEQQVELKQGQLQELVSLYQPFKPRIFMIGHSIGAYIGLRIATPGVNLIGLFPTLLYLNRSPNGRRMSWMFKPVTRRLLSLLGYVLGALPQQLLSVMLSPWNSGVTAQVVTKPRAIYNCLTMAHDEMTKIKDEALYWERKETKLSFYYASGDAWVEEHHPELVKSAYSHAEITYLKDVPHAFVLGYGELMAQRLGQSFL